MRSVMSLKPPENPRQDTIPSVKVLKGPTGLRKLMSRSILITRWRLPPDRHLGSSSVAGIWVSSAG